MICNVCGTQLPDGVQFCSNCGARWDDEKYVMQQAQQPEQQTWQQPEQQAWQQPAQPEQPPIWQQQPSQAPGTGKFTTAPDGLDRAAFIKGYAKNRKSCASAAIIGYICAALSAVVGLIQGNTSILIDVAIILALSILLHIKQSRVCAILLAVYAVFSCVITSISMGTFAGWWLLIAGFTGLVGAFGCEKEWKEYQAEKQTAGQPY